MGYIYKESREHNKKTTNFSIALTWLIYKSPHFLMIYVYY